MKKSTSIMLGAVLAAGVSFACASGDEYTEVQADNQEICVEKDTGERVDFDKCDDDHAHVHYYPWYHSSARGPAPAVGSKINPLYGSSVKPASGSIARPPATGGFGMSRISSGT